MFIFSCYSLKNIDIQGQTSGSAQEVHHHCQVKVTQAQTQVQMHKHTYAADRRRMMNAPR